jgi:hypothetical protein
MGSLSYMSSVIDRNVVMQRIPVLHFEAPQLIMCVCVCLPYMQTFWNIRYCSGVC